MTVREALSKLCSRAVWDRHSPAVQLLSVQGIEGQSTVEFALIAAGLAAMIVAFGLLWHAFESGLFIDHAIASASHHIQGVFAGVVGDVFMY